MTTPNIESMHTYCGVVHLMRGNSILLDSIFPFALEFDSIIELVYTTFIAVWIM